MPVPRPSPSQAPHRRSAVQRMADQAFLRAAGAPLVPGNDVRLLLNAEQNYPAWLDAIRGAEKFVHFESYIIHADKTGHLFADALIEKARQGVKVRVVYDWLGSFGLANLKFWRRVRAAGVEVRAFNPPSFRSPFSLMSRDHRKMLGVDGRIAFVAGLCVGDCWVGNPARGTEAWRDTGVVIHGPAVADVEAAFSDVWTATGTPLPPHELVDAQSIADAGDVAVRVIGTQPSMTGVLRMDTLVASLARERLWLTDPYFVGMSAYVQALVAAAQDGVDVRLLVPGGSDIAVISPLTRSGYRQLLEAGVRIYEWNGTMIHAKTAVADGHWARVGSTNLNLQSWLGNWELDVAVEDDGFAAQMEAAYERDLENATEVILENHRVRLAVPRRMRNRGRRGLRGRWRERTGRTAASALRIGNVFGAALTAKRPLGAAEATTLLYGSLLTGGLAAAATFWPKAIAYPVAVLLGWLALTWAYDAWRLYRERPGDILSVSKRAPESGQKGPDPAEGSTS